MTRSYPYYVGLVIAALGLATFFGWSFASVDEVKSVPKSVRDNPGAYRSHYRSHRRYFGGKGGW